MPRRVLCVAHRKQLTALPQVSAGPDNAQLRVRKAPLLELAQLAVLAKLQSGFNKLGQWLQRSRIDRLILGETQLLGRQRAPLSAAFLALPVLPGGGFNDLFMNRVFLAGFWAWFTAQFLKIFTKRYKKGIWDIRAIVDSGGMPSSHSALVAVSSHTQMHPHNRSLL
eukprot:jgi/Chrzof1/10714/Cz05g09230.t1